MIRSISAAIVFSIVSAWQAAAEPVVIRTGEHQAFTRIVLQLPEFTEWNLENETGRSRLLLENFSAGFDLSQAFEIIPRTRLAALLAQESVLEMQLACDCPVTAFAEENGFLVIDISDGPALTLEPEAPVSSSPLPRSEFAYGELLWNERILDSTSEQDAELSESNAPVAGETSGPNAEDEAQLILETQRRLLQAFAGAASQGVLDVTEPVQVNDTEAESKKPEPEIFDSSSLEIENEAPATSNIRITNSNDVPVSDRLGNLAMSGSSCPEPSIVDVAQWGSEAPIHSQLGALNQKLFDDAGRLDRQVALKLSKLYLYFGFGAEALQVLALQSELEASHPELVDIANIFEHGFANNPRILHRFADCNSDLSLWGILAAQQTPTENAIDAKAALRGLHRLPSHLKFFLGQELSQRLIQRGDMENADLALRSYQDLLENDGKPPKIGEAQALLLKDEEDSAKQTLNVIIEEDTSDAPEAIIALIEEKIADGQSVPADIALLAEAYAFELRETPVGKDMFRAFVRASTSSGQFDKSFAALKEGATQTDDQMRYDLTNELFKTVANQSTDAQFLEIVFNKFPEFRQSIGAEEQLDLAQRLFAMGFVTEASEITDVLQVSSRSEEIRLLKAKILLHNGSFDASIAQLEGLTSPEAMKVKAEALEKMGQNAAAAQNFYEADMPDRAVSNLWLSDSWSELVDPDTPIYGAAVQLNDIPKSDVIANSEMLSSTEAAIKNSSSVRSNLKGLLEALEVSTE